MIIKKEVKKILHVDSLAAGAKTALADCETLELDKVSTLAVTVRVTHNASATDPVRVHLLSSTEEIVFDTADYATFDSHLLTGKESQKTVAVTPDFFLLKAQLENLDATYAATDIDVYATLGRRQ